MTRAQANLLRAFSLWTVYVWVTRIVNIVGDDQGLGFTIVHSGLALVSIALAAAAWVVVARVRRRTARSAAGGDEPRARGDDVSARVG